MQSMVARSAGRNGGARQEIGRARYCDAAGRSDGPRDGIGDLADADRHINALVGEVGEAVIHDEIDGDLGLERSIRFRLSAKIEALYRKFGHDLPKRNGDGGWSLPMPASFVVARGEIIATAFADPDFWPRLDPDAALAALQPHRAA